MECLVQILENTLNIRNTKSPSAPVDITINTVYLNESLPIATEVISATVEYINP